MKNNELLKKKIIYRATHRGSKEMDLLLGSFVKFYIDNFNLLQLRDLHNLTFVEDEVLYKWYFHKIKNSSITDNKVSLLFQNFNRL
jgi:succinate dehydrogenase flavin-adding protein (antitoxin of CptAB toxin-antitoxin module)